MPLWKKRSQGEGGERDERVGVSDAEAGATGQQSIVTPTNPPVEYTGSITVRVIRQRGLPRSHSSRLWMGVGGRTSRAAQGTFPTLAH